MNTVREKALRLRLQGKSYNEIRGELGVAKSTLSAWLRDVLLADTARKRLESRVKEGVLKGLVKRNKLQTHLAQQRASQAKKGAQLLVPRLEHGLLMAGVLLYWAEGYKRLQVRNDKEITSHIVSLLNSDSELIRTFVRFLTEILNVPREDIRLTIRLYAHINEKEARRFWLKVTKLPEKCFTNSTYLISGASKRRRPYNRLPYGTLQVAVYNTNTFYRLMGLLEGVKKQL